MRARLARAVGFAIALAAVPATASAHTINEKYEAPLPLVAYVAGAALAVGMSFVFVSLRQQSNPPNVALGRVRNVSASHPLAASRAGP